MNLQVTSVSKKEQQLSNAGAAVFVITQEDIRRSGATDLPDVLRMVPGVDVARINANRWAIGIRGFNDAYSNKVLVLVDGRSVYNATFNGVFWDSQNIPLENIERIEVIRGPGGTVWGANAVNGVINIITKRASETQGALIASGAGSEQRADGLFEYGAAAGETGAYRVYGRYFDVGDSPSTAGQSSGDGWHAYQGGFRSDWNVSQRDNLTVQGDLQTTSGDQPLLTMFSDAIALPKYIDDPVENDLGNMLGRWTHTLDGGSEMTFQIYGDHVHRSEQGFQETINTFDFDFQHHLTAGSRNDIVWGVSLREIMDQFHTGYAFGIYPAHRDTVLVTGFVQDELRLTEGLHLTVGSKYEHSDFTGCDFEPSAQLVWSPNSRHAIWTSAAGATRQISPMDAGMQTDAASFLMDGTLAVVRLLGNPKLMPEGLRDVETGYRAQLTKSLSVDVALFASWFNHLQVAVPDGQYYVFDSGAPYMVFDYMFQNQGKSHTYGGEIFANWKVTNRWKLTPSYSLLRGAIEGAGPANTQIGLTPGSAPRNQVQIQSSMNVRRNVAWDSTLAYVGHLQFGNIPAYTRLDSRIGWHAFESVEFSLAGQNLLTARHPEFGDNYGLIHTEVERSVFGKVVWRF